MNLITHLDADAFFASVEQAADPRLRGRPVAVGGEKRGIIASASYEARKFGVYTPMPTVRARRLCPKLVVLPGVGPKTAGRLTAAGLARIGQVAATPVGLLELLVGSAAPVLRRLANGIDERPIIPVRDPAKSYSQQATFAQDQTDEEFLEATLRRMADELMAKVRADAKAVRTLTVKVRYNDMAEDQCSESLAEPTDLETDLYGRLHTMLRNAWKRRVSLRLVSLKLSNLYEGVFRQELALDREAQNSEARRRLARAVDELGRERGRRVILRGHDFVLRDRQRREERGERREKTENPGGRSEERRTELGARSSGIPRKAGAQSSGSQVPSCQAPPLSPIS